MYRFTTTQPDHATRTARRSSFDVLEENGRDALEGILEEWPLDAREHHLEDVLEDFDLGRDLLLAVFDPEYRPAFLKVERVAA